MPAGIFPLLTVAVFTLGYVAITLEHTLKVNKAAIAILMAVVCWAFNFMRVFPNDADLIRYMNGHLGEIAQVIVFVLGAMTIVELIDSHKGFQFITKLVRTNDKRLLLWIISIITFFVSAVLDNMTTAIVMVTLLRRFLDDRKERMVFASMVIVAANAGGAWSPIGDVTTTMLWLGERISSGALISRVFLPSMVSVAVPLIFVSFSVRGQIPPGGHPGAGEQAMHGAKRILALGVGALIMVPVLHATTGMPPYLGILLGLGLMWVMTDLIHQERHFLRVPHIFTKIDIASVLFFLGILLAVAALETIGVLGRITAWMDHYIGNQDAIVSFLGLVSAFIDNVPLTAAVMGMYDPSLYPMDNKIWEMTAYAVGTGGSLLIIGSAAGVVVMGMEKIHFGWYLKRISLPVFLGYLAGLWLFLYKF